MHPNLKIQKNLARYAAINYKHGTDAYAKSTKEIIAPTFMVPTIEELDTNNNMKVKIWEGEYDK